MTVELHIGNVKTHIKNLTDLTIIDAISRILTYRLESARYSWQYKSGMWDGSHKLLTKNLYFPSGCLTSVTAVLDGKNIPYKLIDNRDFCPLPEQPLTWQGYELYPYQQGIVDVALDKKCGMIKACTGSGKAQPLYSKLLTPTGWITMGEVQVGDEIISQNGVETKVTGVYPQGEKNVYRVWFTDGSYTDCCDDHLWLTHDADERRKPNHPGSVKTLKSIRKTLRKWSDSRRNHSIPMVEPIEFKQKHALFIDPYLMGVLLGDGSFRYQLKLTSADQELINGVSKLIDKCGCKIKHDKNYDYNIISDVPTHKNGRLKNNIKNEICELGLWMKKSHEKFIPKRYLFASAFARIALLQGLLDTDGTISKNGKSITFTTVSKQLSLDFQFLVQSLGGTAKTITRTTSYKYDGAKKIGKKSFRTTVVLPNQIKPFKLKRKQDRVVARGKYFPRRYIDRVEFVGRNKTQCISVDAPSKLYVTDNCIVTHNTLMIAKMVYEFNLPTVIYVVSLDLLTQMKETLEMCLGIPIGMVGNGICDIQQITVCSAWTAGRIYSKANKKKVKEDREEDVWEDKWSPSVHQKQSIQHMIESAKVVMLDEAQFAAASSIRAILSNSKAAAYRYGFSGTPWRSGGDDLLLEAAFGDNICDLKATELIYKGYLVPPKIAFRDVIPPLKPLKRTWNEVKSKFIIENEQRNDMLIRNVVKLLDMGRKPLVLFREHKHGKILESMLPNDVRYRYVTGDVSKAERDQIREDFKNGDVDLILASTVYDQGIDLPALDALVLAGGGKSTAKALQRIGRVIRGNPDGGKKDAMVVETYDQAHFVKKHSIMRYQIYKTEPGFQIKTGIAMTKYVDRYKP